MKNTECKKCRWSNNRCVNQGKFKDGDCLQYNYIRKEDRKKSK